MKANPVHHPLILRTVVTILAATVFSACTNLRNDRSRTQAEGATAGAATGALLGAGAGALLAKNKKKGALLGAATGALAGAAAGAAYGTQVADKKEGYARTEDMLDRRLKETKREIARRHTFNNGLRYEIQRQQERLAKLNTAGAATSLAVEQFEIRSSLARRLGELERENRSWQASIDAHKAALEQYKRDPRAASLRGDIATLSQESAELTRQRSALAELSRRAQ